MRLGGVILAGIVLTIGFSGCSTKENIPGQIQSYKKPENATVRLEGQKYPYCVWFDPKKWIIVDTPFDPCDEISEWTLVLLDLEKEVSIGKNIEKKAYAKTYPYKESNISRSDYKDFVQTKILGHNKESLQMFKDLGSEERLINGIKVFAWTFEVQYQNIEPITAYLYFYSDGEGSVAITTFTPSNKWKENKRNMEGFLNGFCLMQPSSSSSPSTSQ